MNESTFQRCQKKITNSNKIWRNIWNEFWNERTKPNRTEQVIKHQPSAVLCLFKRICANWKRWSSIWPHKWFTHRCVMIYINNLQFYSLHILWHSQRLIKLRLLIQNQQHWMNNNFSIDISYNTITMLRDLLFSGFACSRCPNQMLCVI